MNPAPRTAPAAHTSAGTLAITLAVAALASAPPAAAQACAAAGDSVTSYGLFHAAMRRINNASAGRGRLRTMDDGIFTGTRLGFRSRENLGGGLWALFTPKAGFDPSSGLSLQGTAAGDYGQVTAPTRAFGRESHVGLRTAWGGATAGCQYTVAHSIAARFQPLGNPNSGWAAGAVYHGGALALGAYVQQMKNLAGSETRKIAGLGGNYRFAPAFQLFGGVMQRTNAVSPQENLAFTIGAYCATASDALAAWVQIR
jgi:predicted porin